MTFLDSNISIYSSATAKHLLLTLEQYGHWSVSETYDIFIIRLLNLEGSDLFNFNYIIFNANYVWPTKAKYKINSILENIKISVNM